MRKLMRHLDVSTLAFLIHRSAHSNLAIHNKIKNKKTLRRCGTDIWPGGISIGWGLSLVSSRNLDFLDPWQS